MLLYFWLLFLLPGGEDFMTIFNRETESSGAAVETWTVKIVMASILLLKSSELYQHPQDNEINVFVWLGKTHSKGKIYAALCGICYLIFLQSNSPQMEQAKNTRFLICIADFRALCNSLSPSRRPDCGALC